jgi:hypothetical protein
LKIPGQVIVVQGRFLLIVDAELALRIPGQAVGESPAAGLQDCCLLDFFVFGGGSLGAEPAGFGDG